MTADDKSTTANNQEASRLLMEAADFFAATLASADPQAWSAVLTYAPQDMLIARLKEIGNA